MSVTIQLRRGTALAWSIANPVLAVGEIGVNTDDLSYKIGDGVTVTFFAAPNAASIGWRVARLDRGDVASGTITTDLPPTTTFLAPHIYVNNNAVAAAVILDFYRYYL